MYLAALEAWNESDGSTRRRIRLPQLVNALGDAASIEANAGQEPPVSQVPVVAGGIDLGSA